MLASEAGHGTGSPPTNSATSTVARRVSIAPAHSSAGSRRSSSAGLRLPVPAFARSSPRIVKEQQAQALAAGYAVVDQTAALATHLGEIIRQNANELLTRQETKRLIDRLSESHPKLVEELVPKLMTLGEVQRVLQQLLREQVSIRDLGQILETLIETAGVSKNPVLLERSRAPRFGTSAGSSTAR